jgi:hypothetical protein
LGRPRLTGAALSHDPQVEARYLNDPLVHFRASVRLYTEIWNAGGPAELDGVLAKDFIDYDVTYPIESHINRDQFKEHFGKLHSIFSNARITNEDGTEITEKDMVAEGDKVVLRYTFSGTHNGEFMGIPPTNKKIMMTGMVLFRIAGGQIKEAWANSDDLGMLKQLGKIDLEKLGIVPYPIGQVEG